MSEHINYVDPIGISADDLTAFPEKLYAIDKIGNMEIRAFWDIAKVVNKVDLTGLVKELANKACITHWEVNMARGEVIVGLNPILVDDAQREDIVREIEQALNSFKRITI